MPQYRLALAERDGTVIEDNVLERTGFPEGDAGIRYTRTLNDPGSIEFTLPIDDPFVTPATFEGLSHEVRLYRDEALVAAGPLLMGEFTSKVAVRFTAKGFGWWLSRREVDDDLVYNSVDQLQIAWNLIAFTQAKTDGNIGITRGSATPSGVTRSISYCLDQRPNILDEVGKLGATDDGFDFEVGPDKVFRTWHPLRGSTTSIVLDTMTNVVGLADFARDYSEISNEVTGIKGGGNCETPVTELALDTVSRGAYGLLQSNVSNSDVTAAHLAAIAADELRISSTPRIQPTVVLDASIADVVDMPDLADYDLGDEVMLQSTLGWASMNATFRIVEISVLSRPNGLERISIKLDSHGLTP